MGNISFMGKNNVSFKTKKGGGTIYKKVKIGHNEITNKKFFKVTNADNELKNKITEQLRNEKEKVDNEKEKLDKKLKKINEEKDNTNKTISNLTKQLQRLKDNQEKFKQELKQNTSNQNTEKLIKSYNEKISNLKLKKNTQNDVIKNLEEEEKKLNL